MSVVKKTLSILIFFSVTAAAIFFRRELEWCLASWESPVTFEQTAIVPTKTGCPKCNLILISLDTLRADRVGFTGSTMGLTPNLDRIAARSTVFANAYTNAFFTTPSHMTLFTSLYPTTHRVEATEVKVPRLPMHDAPPIPLDARFQTAAEMLRARNFDTAWIAPLKFKFLEFRDGFGRGFNTVESPVFMRGLHFPLEKPMAFERARLKKILASLRKPYFAFVHSYVNHLPYVVPDDKKMEGEIPFHGREVADKALRMILRRNPETLFVDYEKNGFDADAAADACQKYASMENCFTKYVTPDLFVHRIGQWQLRLATKFLHAGNYGAERARIDQKAYEDAYAYNVGEVDRQVGQLWDELESSGILRNTVVVIVSDHGEELFDHGEGNHSSFFEHTARVPALIYVPGAEPQVTRELFSLVDILPSVFDILGLEKPSQAQGTSAFDSSAPRKYVFGAALGVTYVRDREWKLITQEQGGVELYNLRTDALEKHNLIGLRLPIIRAKVEELERALAEFRLSQAL